MKYLLIIITFLVINSSCNSVKKVDDIRGIWINSEFDKNLIETKSVMRTSPKSKGSPLYIFTGSLEELTRMSGDFHDSAYNTLYLNRDGSYRTEYTDRIILTKQNDTLEITEEGNTSKYIFISEYDPENDDILDLCSQHYSFLFEGEYINENNETFSIMNDSILKGNSVYRFYIGFDPWMYEMTPLPDYFKLKKESTDTTIIIKSNKDTLFIFDEVYIKK